MLIIDLSIEWGWPFRFACFVHYMFLHLPSSCEGLLLSSYLPSFAKPSSITVCQTFVSSLFRSFGFQVDQLLPQVLGLVSQGVTISPPYILVYLLPHACQILRYFNDWFSGTWNIPDGSGTWKNLKKKSAVQWQHRKPVVCKPFCLV